MKTKIKRNKLALDDATLFFRKLHSEIFTLLSLRQDSHPVPQWFKVTISKISSCPYSSVLFVSS